MHYVNPVCSFCKRALGKVSHLFGDMDMPEEQLRRLLELESYARALWAEAATRIPEDAWGRICKDVAAIQFLLAFQIRLMFLDSDNLPE